jgi:hypothetical protein
MVIRWGSNTLSMRKWRSVCHACSSGQACLRNQHRAIISREICKRAIYLAAFLLILVCQSDRFTQADDVTVIAAPIPVVTSDRPGIFPESWLKPSIAASGGELPAAEFERVQRILVPALAKYPEALLKQHLRTIYVLSELKYSGVITSGTNSRNAVYVKIGDVSKGFTDTHNEAVFHAELSSILLRNQPKFLDENAWKSVNPPDFKYLGSGVDAVKQKKAGLKLDERLHEQGFLKEYAQSNLENDFNAFAAMIFAGDGSIWPIAEKHAAIRKKLDLTIDFYHQLDPAFTEDYFRKLGASAVTTQP